MSEREELELPLGQYLTDDVAAPDHDRVWAKVCARRAARRGADLRERPPALPVPLAETLLGQEELTVARARVWRAVLARVRRPQPRPRMARPFLVFASLVCGVAVALLVAKNPESFRAGPAALAQPLQRADGVALGALDASEQAQVVRLSDASEIRLARGARLEPLQSSGSRFELLLARGSAEFSVTPGGPRRWLVEAGAARVEVVGTVFRVDRRPEQVVVSVSRGAVLVRGENVPGWVQKLTAGQQIEVPARGGAGRSSEAPPQPPAEQRIPTVEAVVTVTTPEPEAPAALAAPSRPARHGRRQHQARAARLDQEGSRLEALEGTPDEQYAALGLQGFAHETSAATSIETLLRLADIARLSGHPQEAIYPLTRALEAFSGSPQAALAAFTLGRVQLDQLNLPAPAAAAFERAVALRLPRALLPDCYRRLAEAYGRAGDAEARTEALQRLRASFGSEGDAPQPAKPAL